MEIKKETSQITYVVQDVLCDKCGASTRLNFFGHRPELDFVEAQTNHAILQYHPGYGSKFDCVRFEAHLCEDCFLEFFNQCKTAERKEPRW